MLDTLLRLYSSTYEMVQKMMESPEYIGLFIGRIVVFGLLVFAFYSLLDYLQKFSVISTKAAELVHQTNTQVRLRMDRAFKVRQEMGAQDKVSFIYKLDLLILQSNIRKHAKWLNTQIYILLTLVASVGSMILVLVTTNNSSLGIATCAFVAVAFYGVLVALSGMNYKKVEKGLVAFANIAENFSKSSDDLITILDRVSWYVDDPLKSALRECVETSKNTGDTSAAIERLQLRIEHPQFRQLMRNLEVASRHEANYGEIIEDNRKTLQDYIAFQQERAAIYANGRVELIGVAVAGVMALFMIQDMAETSIVEVLTETIFGTIISVYFVFVAIYIIYVMFFSAIKDKSGGAY